MIGGLFCERIVRESRYQGKGEDQGFHSEGEGIIKVDKNTQETMLSGLSYKLPQRVGGEPSL